MTEWGDYWQLAKALWRMPTETAEEVLERSGADLSGKVVIITGGSAGIGKETTRVLANAGAHVIVASRSGRSVIDELQPARGTGRVEFRELDLSSYDSVRSFVEWFLARKLPLHILINNAGRVVPSRTTNGAGHEMTFATNFLGPFLLTNLLLDVLRQSAPSRIVLLTSNTHWAGHVDFDDLHCSRRWYWRMQTYANSKLAMIFFAKELARRLAGTRVTVNAVHPGQISTGMASTVSGISQWIIDFFSVTLGEYIGLLAPVTKGACAAVYAAVSPDLDSVTGAYIEFTNSAAPFKAIASDSATAQRLWEVSAELVGLR